jgi:hypothetical protein
MAAFADNGATTGLFSEGFWLPKDFVAASKALSWMEEALGGTDLGGDIQSRAFGLEV